MLYVGGLGGFLLLAFWIYCILDVVMAEPSLVRNLPKLVWLIFVLFVPTVGGLVWFIAGRPAKATFVPGSTTLRGGGRARRPRGPAAPKGPDDDPRFLRDLDDRLRRERDDEPEAGPDADPA